MISDEVKAVLSPYQVQDKISFNPLIFLEMGTIKQGILGGFSGKVGTVIGGSWKGISYMRSIPQSVKNPRTDGQVNQRTKFTVALDFLKPMTGLIQVGFKLYAQKQTAFNAAMSYILNNAITGTSPDFSVYYNLALVSRGSLTGAVNAQAASANGAVNITWDDNSGSGTATQTDKALIVVLNSTRAESVFDAGGNQRGFGTEDISVPADWAGENVEVFLGFITEDGKNVSNSVYLGTVTVA